MNLARSYLPQLAIIEILLLSVASCSSEPSAAGTASSEIVSVNAAPGSLTVSSTSWVAQGTATSSTAPPPPALDPVASESFGTLPSYISGEPAIGPSDSAGGAGLFLMDTLGVDTDGQLVVLTWGSSTCPSLVSDSSVDASGVLNVKTRTVDLLGQESCTSDIAPTTSFSLAPTGAKVGSRAKLNGKDVVIIGFS